MHPEKYRAALRIPFDGPGGDTDRAVLVLAAARCDDDGYCRVSAAALAGSLGVKPRTVAVSLDRLGARGLVSAALSPGRNKTVIAVLPETSRALAPSGA